MDRTEAIEVIKKNYPHAGFSGSEFETALRELIPELTESEDERIRKPLINIVKGACDTCGIKYIGDEISQEIPLAYLEKQKEQKPAEWSEEDEKMRQRVIDTLKTVLSIRDEDDPIFAGSEMIRWIKNLHPQYKLIDEDRIRSVLPPHWKPSEEQMASLDYVLKAYESTEIHLYEGVAKQIRSLYEDLKKLM